MGESFLHLRRNGEGFEVRGLTQARLGHKLPQANGDCDGIFAEWSWDGGRLCIRNDRYGFYPLYYFATADEVAVSTSIVGLLQAGAPRTLDDEALAAFLRLGFFLAEDTPFLAIRALPPAATVEWENGQLSVSGGITIAKPYDIKRRAAVDGYIALFRDSIRRRRATQPTVAVTLSGGRDSRHILFELCEQGLRPDFCLTARGFPSPAGAAEVDVAANLCRLLDLPHIILDQRQSLMQAELTKNQRTGFCSFEHNWYTVVADHLNQTAGAVYDGIGGDVLSAGLFLSAQRVEWCEQGQLRELAGDMVSAVNDQVIEQALQPELARRFNRETAFARFEREFRRHENAPNPIGSYHFWNRTRRLISLCPYGMLPDVPEVFSPYLDHSLFDFLVSLPASMLVDHRFHSETIARAYPAYADIPYAQRKSLNTSYRGHYRSLAFSVAQSLLRTNKHAWLRRSYFLPRLARCLTDPGYLPSAEWLGALAIYLTQLETAAET